MSTEFNVVVTNFPRKWYGAEHHNAAITPRDAAIPWGQTTNVWARSKRVLKIRVARRLITK